MGNLNPHLRDIPDFQHKLWDQLFMSILGLIDSPLKNQKRIYFLKSQNQWIILIVRQNIGFTETLQK